MLKRSKSRLGHLALAASMTLGLGIGATVVTATSASAAPLSLHPMAWPVWPKKSWFRHQNCGIRQ